MNTSLAIHLTRLLACASLAASPVFAQTTPNTYFADKHGTFPRNGGYWHQAFTVGTSSDFVLRVAADYVADTAIIAPSQLSNFINNRAFSGYALFDNSFGTKSLTLSPGTYYLAVRNQNNGANTYRLELDYDIKLPADSTYTYQFVDNYIQGTQTVGARGGKLWHPFTVQSGYRYLIDGCNTGLGTYVIPASQLSAFRNNSTFNYYIAYSSESDNALPGLHEIKLNPGSYYIAFENSNAIPKAVTYAMERWRQTIKTSGGIADASIDLSGTSSWSRVGTSIDIKVAKVANRASGTSGSLRLRIWATKSRYAGGSLSGYVLGTRSLSPLQAGNYYSNISGNVAYTRPPVGTYYTLLAVEEYTSSGWRIRDYINFSGTTTF